MHVRKITKTFKKRFCKHGISEASELLLLGFHFQPKDTFFGFYIHFTTHIFMTHFFDKYLLFVRQTVSFILFTITKVSHSKPEKKIETCEDKGVFFYFFSPH